MLKNIKQIVKDNYKEYTLIGLVFIIGIFIGVLIINNCDDSQVQEIKTYIGEFINKFKNIDKLKINELIGTSIKNNLTFASLIWIAGTTIIGIPIVIILILYRGLCLGFTVATFSFSLGKYAGIIFCILGLLLQNIIFIPAILTLGVSSIKLYKSIVKDRNRDNIKREIIRHTITLIVVMILLVFSAIVENIISIPVLRNFIKYF